MKEWNGIESVHSWAAREMFNSDNWPDQLAPSHTSFKFDQINQITTKTKMNTQQYKGECVTESQSPAEKAFREIDHSLTILAEAVNRIGIKTDKIRITPPAYPTTDKDKNPLTNSQFVERLLGIASEIQRNVEDLNIFSDEIEL
jgi:hypothetical protein